MRRLFGCPDIVSLTEKFLMARNFFRIFTENNPVMWDSKTFSIPEAKGLIMKLTKTFVSFLYVSLHSHKGWIHLQTCYQWCTIPLTACMKGTTFANVWLHPVIWHFKAHQACYLSGGARNQASISNLAKCTDTASLGIKPSVRFRSRTRYPEGYFYPYRNGEHVVTFRNVQFWRAPGSCCKTKLPSVLRQINTGCSNQK